MEKGQSAHERRKEIKKKAKSVLKQHYGIFLIACIFAVILGCDFAGSLNFVQLPAMRTETTADGTTETENIAAQGMLVSRDRQIEIVSDMLLGDRQDATKTADESKQQSIASVTNSALGRSRGVFAQIVNGLTSGSMIITAILAIRNLTGSDSVATAIFIVLSLVVMVAVWMFIINVYRVVMQRIFLEGRTYENVGAQRFLFLLRVRGWTKAAKTMLLEFIYYFLWSLTVVGMPIKMYSYRMVPYIVAENPSLPANRAITLSRRMMDGHKWECFMLDLSFIGWSILKYLTLGISAVLYSNPYCMATFAEYYAMVRAQYLVKEPEVAAELNDVYLYEVADNATLQKAYGDVLQQERATAAVEPLTGIGGWIIRTFGVTLWNNPREQAYEASEENKLKLHNLLEAAEGKAYPGRLYHMKEAEKRMRVETVHYMRHYSVLSLIMIFFILSFGGWVWEVSLHLVVEGELVNRGLQYGPWLPIYGYGGTLILVVLNKLRKHPVAEFFSAIVLCGCVEYYTAYRLEMTYNGMKWWDYSGYFLNLQGRICAEGLLVFGLGGMAVVYVLAPMLDNLLRKIPNRVLVPVCGVLLILFSVDKAYSSKHPNSGKGITDTMSINYQTVMTVPAGNRAVNQKGGAPWEGQWSFGIRL